MYFYYVLFRWMLAQWWKFQLISLILSIHPCIHLSQSTSELKQMFHSPKRAKLCLWNEVDPFALWLHSIWRKISCILLPTASNLATVFVQINLRKVRICLKSAAGFAHSSNEFTCVLKKHLHGQIAHFSMFFWRKAIVHWCFSVLLFILIVLLALFKCSVRLLSRKKNWQALNHESTKNIFVLFNKQQTLQGSVKDKFRTGSVLGLQHIRVSACVSVDGENSSTTLGECWALPIKSPWRWILHIIANTGA